MKSALMKFLQKAKAAGEPYAAGMKELKGLGGDLTGIAGDSAKLAGGYGLGAGQMAIDAARANPKTAAGLLGAGALGGAGAAYGMQDDDSLEIDDLLRYLGIGG